MLYIHAKMLYMKMKYIIASLKQEKLIMAAILVIAGSIGRLFLRDLPNIETVTAVTIMAGFLLGGIWTFTVGLLVVAITDMTMGNTTILLYTWSAWTFIGLFGMIARGQKMSRTRMAVTLTGLGFVSNFFFYLWTNFGVWHIGGLYPHTWHGLVASYIAGLPFLRNQLASTGIFVPLSVAVFVPLWVILQRRAERRDSVDSCVVSKMM